MIKKWLNNRIYKTLLHKCSLLFTLLYGVIYLYDIFDTHLLFFLFISLILSIGIGGIGYLFNDYNDIEQDQLIGKQNIFNVFAKDKIAILSFISLFFATIPWFFLPFTRVSLLLIFLEFFLFYAYAFKPFRWKENAILGVLSDAFYAHILPALLAIYTFSRFSTHSHFEVTTVLLFILVLWLLLFGVRNIFNHQIEDLHNDIKTNIKTSIQEIGELRMKKLICYVLVPLEFLCFILLQFLLPSPIVYITIPYFIYCLAYFFKKYKIDKYPFFEKENWRSNAVFSFLNGNLLNEYYEKYWPIVLILSFALQDMRYFLLLAFHLLFFMPIYLNK